MASIEVADVLRRFAPSYLEAFGDRLLPSHRRAIEDIMACRTPALGGHVYECADCGQRFHVYHGCRNRSCPACHTRQSADWLEARTGELLACPYYHVCVTVPDGLRDAWRANQRECYGLLMRVAADAVLTLCRDRRYMGATPAVLAVLHTWTARIDYHPHVHLLVSGGGISEDGGAWREARHPFLVPVRALSKLVRGKVRAWLEQNRPDIEATIPAGVWKKDWVTWCQHAGQGHTAVLDYLARYVHRIAISNARLLDMDAQTVTFRYKERKQQRWRTCTLTGHEFIRRFLQHVLPKRLHKVRYYGLWHPQKRALLRNAQHALELAADHAPATRQHQPVMHDSLPQTPPERVDPTDPQHAAPICPHCKSNNTYHVDTLAPQRARCQARASPHTHPDTDAMA